MRNIGDMAENLLSMWCAEAGLTVNTSQQDNMGWDHYIEFPLSNIISHDQVHQSAPKCKVQVKATDKHDRKLQVTLSNLRAMAIDPLPYFFLFVEYDGQSTPQKAFLRLVDNDLIRQILKKIHSINASDKDNKFNKKTMIVKYDGHCEMAELSGQCFNSTLETYFNGNFEKIVTDKLNFIKSVGYEDSVIKLGFQTLGEENIEKIVDVSLGLEDAVSIEQLIAKNTIFGIETIDPLLSSSTATLSMPNLTPTIDAKLIFQKDIFDNHYSFDVGIYFPIINDLNSPYFKTRFKSDFFDIVLTHKTNKLNFKFQFEDCEFDIYYFKKALQLISDLFNGEKLELFIDGKGGKQFLGALTAPNQFIDHQKELETLDKIIKIIKYFDFNGSIRAGYNELCYLGDTIAPFYDLLHSPTANFAVSFSVQDGEIDTSAPIVAIGSIKFRISNKLFIILYSTEGVPTKNDTEKKRKYILQGNLIKIEKKLVCDLKSVPSDDEVLKALKLIESTFEDRLIVILNK